jgi:hypothetical protein
VTKTHHATQVAKAVFQSKAAQASFDAGGEVLDVVRAEASAAWWDSESVSSGFEKQRVGLIIPRYSISILMDVQAPEPDKQGVWPFRTQTNPPGVVVFFGGILWRPGRMLSRKWHAEDVKKKQEYLGSEADAAAAATFVELPGVADGEEELAFLELQAGAVGIDGKRLKLPKIEDSFAIYTDADSDSDSTSD